VFATKSTLVFEWGLKLLHYLPGEAIENRLAICERKRLANEQNEVAYRQSSSSITDISIASLASEKGQSPTLS